MGSKAQQVAVFAVLFGVVLTLIGVRFWLVPSSATVTFGIGAEPPHPTLEWVIALRDVWLGLLAVLFGILRDWRALTCWFALAAFVCFGDAAIVASVPGPALAVGFHAVSGVLCLVLAVSAWQLYKRADP